MKLHYVLFLLFFSVASAEAGTLLSLFGIDDAGISFQENTGNKGKKPTFNANILLEALSKNNRQPSINPPPTGYYYYGDTELTTSIELAAILSVQNNIDDTLRSRGINLYKCPAPGFDCILDLSIDVNGYSTGNSQFADLYFTGTDESPEFFDFSNGKPKYVFIYWHGGAWVGNDPRYANANYIRQRQFINYLESILVNDGSFDAMIISVSYLEGYGNHDSLAAMYDGYTGDITNIGQYYSYNSTAPSNTIAHSFKIILEYINASAGFSNVHIWTAGDSAGAWIAQRLATDRKNRLNTPLIFDSIVEGSFITGTPTVDVPDGEIGYECGSDDPLNIPYIENATSSSTCTKLRYRYNVIPVYRWSNNINNLKYYAQGTDNLTIYLNTACDYWSEVKDARNEWLHLLPQDKLGINIEKKYLDIYNNSGSSDDADDGNKPKFYDDPDLIDISTPIPVGNAHNFEHTYPSFFKHMNWKVTIENDASGKIISALGDMSFYDNSAGTTPINKLDTAVNNQPYGKKGVVYMCHE